MLNVSENKVFFTFCRFFCYLRPIMIESKKGKENRPGFPIKDRVYITDNGSNAYLLMNELYA